jgi:general secretion pathway protein J
MSNIQRIAQRHSSAHGFTLIEVLVAMAIFAVLALMAYSGLRTVINVSSSVQNRVEKLEALQRTFMFLERDFYQLIPRQMNTDGGNVKAALEATPNNARLFEFTRGGQPNPADVKRSSLIRIAYIADEKKLKRIKWNHIDHVADEQVVEITLLDNVESITTRFLDANDQWQLSWGQEENVMQAIPKAIEITLEHKYWGKIRWLIPIYTV